MASYGYLKYSQYSNKGAIRIFFPPSQSIELLSASVTLHFKASTCFWAEHKCLFCFKSFCTNVLLTSNRAATFRIDVSHCS